MQEKVCFDRTKFSVIMIISTIILSVIYYQQKDIFFKYINRNHPEEIKCPDNKCPDVKCPDVKCPDVKCPDVKCPVCIQQQQLPIVISDPVRNYDLRKIDDPLEGPTRRVYRYDIPPRILMNQIDIPTRGYPDNFQQIGLLINTVDDATSNKILRLFGRETFPRSSRYEYYTLIANGLDQIKVPLDTRRNKELYDDDVVSVNSLNTDFKVKLLPYDSPRYYPNVF